MRLIKIYASSNQKKDRKDGKQFGQPATLSTNHLYFTLDDKLDYKTGRDDHGLVIFNLIETS